MEFANVFEQVMEFRSSYPEAISAILGLVGFAVILLCRKMFSTVPLTAEGQSLADLLSCKNRWRWGVKGLNTKRGNPGNPTGNSIVCEGKQGQKVVAIFKSDKYTVDDVPVTLTANDKRRLRKLRNEVVADLKANDAATEAREEARLRQERLNNLNRVA